MIVEATEAEDLAEVEAVTVVEVVIVDVAVAVVEAVTVVEVVIVAEVEAGLQVAVVVEEMTAVAVVDVAVLPAAVVVVEDVAALNSVVAVDLIESHWEMGATVASTVVLHRVAHQVVKIVAVHLVETEDHLDVVLQAMMTGVRLRVVLLQAEMIAVRLRVVLLQAEMIAVRLRVVLLTEMIADLLLVVLLGVVPRVEPIVGLPEEVSIVVHLVEDLIEGLQTQGSVADPHPGDHLTMIAVIVREGVCSKISLYHTKCKGNT